jgi:hypothetical protein
MRQHGAQELSDDPDVLIRRSVGNLQRSMEKLNSDIKRHFFNLTHRHRLDPNRLFQGGVVLRERDTFDPLCFPHAGLR